MSRLARLSITGQLHHVLQRGNNRQPIFGTVRDREVFLGALAHSAAQFGLALHAFVLMDNHFHLLATPSTPEALPKTMQALGRRYVRHFNTVHGRSGTLWEGRYRSTVLQARAHLLACMAYMDLNPVRAGLVEQASDYAWSSYGIYAGLRTDFQLSVPALVWALGNTPFARESAYRDLVQRGVSAELVALLTDSVLHGWAVGDSDFVARMQQETSRRLVRAKPGRPAKAASIRPVVR